MKTQNTRDTGGHPIPAKGLALGAAPPAQAAGDATRPAPDLAALRRQIQQIEGWGAAAAATACVLPLGVPQIDARLAGGGLRRDAIHELSGEAGPILGFAAWIAGRLATPERPAVWIQDGQGLYAPGLAAFGLTPDRLIVIHDVRAEGERLWALEQCLRAGALSVVVADVRLADATVGRRLQLAAATGSTPGLVLPPRVASLPDLVADAAPGGAMAATRWRLLPAPSVPLCDADGVALPGVGHPAWQVALTRSRGGTPGAWVVCWNGQDLTLVDPIAVPEPGAPEMGAPAPAAPEPGVSEQGAPEPGVSERFRPAQGRAGGV